MKGYMVFAILVLTFIVVSQADDSDDTANSSHILQKRQLGSLLFNKKPKPPDCIFYECIRSCREKGYKGGGWCSASGCACYR